MRKSVLILAFTVLLLISPLQQQAAPQSSSNKQTGQSQKVEPQTVIIGSVNDNKAKDKGQEKDALAPKNLDEYTVKGFRLNFALTIIALVTAIAALLQALAAKQNADALIKTERAWVTIAPGLMSPKLYPSWEQGTNYPCDPEKLHMVRHQLPLLIKNVGKTPAQIDEFVCRYIRIASMADLPAEPNYGALQPQGGHWIIPNDTHTTATDLETDNGILYERHVRDIQLGQSFLFAFGILKYRDVHGKPHETRFSFIYNFPNQGIVAADGTDISKPYFRKDGPPKYNYAN
jgi:hypothetical protein